ncbi:MAG: TonB-dependent receptor [Phenylobacterium sp.]|uniref:TonB-dependent receptor n=1 Tax=Phenylobacterium sp. TaxID=1871053 RepID=UPI0025DC60CF|nr:TonB-dependent receptor [Phenylobacterium sp.]MBI1197771.1 TonB-dependent receptor [Phenylobacterium sp.]
MKADDTNPSCVPRWTLGLLATTMLTAVSAPALAQTGSATVGLEEVVVTAQKRSENLQDVPISIQALGTERLDQLQVKDVNDYVKFMPSVTAQTLAPGFTTFYMRGVASGENNNHSGPLPSVGIYLDEQPVTTITGPLDIHVYDIARVEVLAGPQGTLYGASSQAGTIRIITNKPSLSGFSASYDVEGNTVAHGDPGYSAEGYVNMPLGDRMAIRLVAWGEHDGGYIDNVASTLTYPTGPVTINNAPYVEKNYNEVDITGARAALKIDLDDNWTITPSLMGQRTEADGNFSADRYNKGKYAIARYRPERSDDKWFQAAATIEGTVSNIDLTYAGAYMRRWIDTESDYSDYSYFYDTLFGYGAYTTDNAGNPIDTTQYIQGKDYFTKQSHELRLATPSENRFKVVAGLFYQRQTHNIQQRYKIDNLADATEVPGWDDTLWLTKQLRIDRDYAAFADATYDVSDHLSITGGIRFFRYKNSLAGFFGFGTGYSSGTGVGACFGPPVVEGGPCTNVDKVTKDTGHTYRINAQWKFDDDRMVYATVSTGFRPGGINRRGTLPPYKADFLKNYEFGWKTSWFGNTLRWNGAAFIEKWNDFQFSYLGANGLTEIRNAGKAKMKGVETDINWLVADGLTLTGGGAYTDAQLDEDYIPDPSAPPAAFRGDRLPVTPKWKGNLTARYEWPIGEMDAHVQSSVVYTGPGYPDLTIADRAVTGKTPQYVTVDMTAGVQKGSWRVEAYVKNLFDEYGQNDRYVQCNTAVCTRVYVIPIRPRTVGLRFGQSF